MKNTPIVIWLGEPGSLRANIKFIAFRIAIYADVKKTTHYKQLRPL